MLGKLALGVGVKLVDEGMNSLVKVVLDLSLRFLDRLGDDLLCLGLPFSEKAVKGSRGLGVGRQLGGRQRGRRGKGRGDKSGREGSGSRKVGGSKGGASDSLDARQLAGRGRRKGQRLEAAMGRASNRWQSAGGWGGSIR